MLAGEWPRRGAQNRARGAVPTAEEHYKTTRGTPGPVPKISCGLERRRRRCRRGVDSVADSRTDDAFRDSRTLVFIRGWMGEGNVGEPSSSRRWALSASSRVARSIVLVIGRLLHALKGADSHDRLVMCLQLCSSQWLDARCPGSRCRSPRSTRLSQAGPRVYTPPDTPGIDPLAYARHPAARRAARGIITRDNSRVCKDKEYN